MDEKFHEAIRLYKEKKYKAAIDAMSMSATISSEKRNVFVAKCKALIDKNTETTISHAPVERVSPERQTPSPSSNLNIKNEPSVIVWSELIRRLIVWGIFIACVYYCNTHESDYVVGKQNLLLWEVDKTEMNMLWYFLALVVIVTFFPSVYYLFTIGKIFSED